MRREGGFPRGINPSGREAGHSQLVPRWINHWSIYLFPLTLAWCTVQLSSPIYTYILIGDMLQTVSSIYKTTGSQLHILVVMRPAARCDKRWNKFRKSLLDGRRTFNWWNIYLKKSRANRLARIVHLWYCATQGQMSIAYVNYLI